MPTWAIVAEEYDKVGFRAGVPRMRILTQIESTREQAEAELIRQAREARLMWFLHRNRKHRQILRHGDSFLVVDSGRRRAPTAVLTLWEQVATGA